MPGVSDMVSAAEGSIGMAQRPNMVTRWYANRNGNEFLRGPWCDMAITHWAATTGNYDAVCFGVDFAYTVWHAQKFQKMGAWHSDVSGVRHGDVVFFDWSGSNDVSRIDHVGLVTAVKGADVHTIEGNTDDRCARRVRRAETIVGYGRPSYVEAPVLKPHAAYPVLSVGAKDPHLTGIFPEVTSPVQTLQNALNILLGLERTKYKLTPDGDFGKKTLMVVTYYQQVNFNNASGQVGGNTWNQIFSDLHDVGR